MATLTISNDIFERLAKKAQERRVSVDDLVAPVLEQLVQESPSPPKQLKAINEFVQFVNEHAPELPEGFELDDSRETIYGDRGL